MDAKLAQVHQDLAIFAARLNQEGMEIRVKASDPRRLTIAAHGLNRAALSELHRKVLNRPLEGAYGTALKHILKEIDPKAFEKIEVEESAGGAKFVKSRSIPRRIQIPLINREIILGRKHVHSKHFMPHLIILLK